MKVIKCSNCKKDKDIEDFSLRSGKRNKQCKSCREHYNTLWKNNPNDYKEKRKKYYRDNRERHQERNFKNSIFKKYSLSKEEYDQMLEAQKNRCAICNMRFVTTGDKKDLHKLPCIDHSHQTNKVRALLCRRCNISLGHIESGFFEKAKTYLEVHEIKDKEPL